MLGDIWMTSTPRIQTLSLTDLNIGKPVFSSQGINFGAGSSREHAAWALADYGFKVVIAGSFGDIHYNNELNNGMLPIVQPREVREKLAQLQPSDQVTVDLEQQKIISPVGEFTFEIDSEWKHKLLNGLDDIGITLQYEDLIAAYEKQRPAYWQD